MKELEQFKLEKVLGFRNMQKKLENIPFCGIELDDGTYHLPYNYLGERPTHLIVTYLLDLAGPS